MKRLNRMQLRRLISETVFREQTEPSQKNTPAGTLRSTGETAPDNKSALIVKNDSALSSLLSTLNTKYSGEYYIWSKSKQVFRDIHQAGSYYKSGSGDPYTYELVGKGTDKNGKEGNKYRVVSGPKHSRAGAKPIGATFVMPGKLTPIPTPPQASEREFPMNPTQVNLLTNKYNEALQEALKAEKAYSTSTIRIQLGIGNASDMFTRTKLSSSLKAIVNDCKNLQAEIQGAIQDNGNKGTVSGEDFDHLNGLFEDILKKHVSALNLDRNDRQPAIASYERFDKVANTKFTKGILSEFFEIGKVLRGSLDAQLPEGKFGDHIQIWRNNFSNPEAANKMIGRSKGGREPDA